MANQDLEFPVNLDAVSGREFVPPQSGDPRRDKCIQWLSAIDKDLTSLAINRMVWRAFTTVWREREPPLPPSFLFAAIGNQYATAQAVGIRRQPARRPDVVSLEALLGELVAHPQLGSRQFFLGRCKWGNQWLGDREFSSLDPRGQGHLDPAIPAADRVGAGRLRRVPSPGPLGQRNELAGAEQAPLGLLIASAPPADWEFAAELRSLRGLL